MTDKELFEKTEKQFNLKRKNNLVVKVFNEGKFKQTLSEKKTSSSSSTSPIGSNYGANTVSAAQAVGSGIGKFGNFLRGVIPGTNTNRRKKAETRKQEALAKQEELKAMQMMYGGKQSKPGKKPTPTEIKFKVGDEVFVKTKKNPKAKGIVTALLAKPGFIQVKIENAPPYAYDKRNVSLRRGTNK